MLDLNAARREGGEAPIANYQALCRELTREGNSNFGELSITGALSILRRYADAWMTTAKKRSDGDASTAISGESDPSCRLVITPARLSSTAAVYGYSSRAALYRSFSVWRASCPIEATRSAP